MAGDPLLQALGRQVSRLRRAAGMTQRVLAGQAAVSLRFLSQLEAGRNVSVAMLGQVAAALDRRPWQLLYAAEIEAAGAGEAGEVLRPGARAVALIGLRGAGKSTIGARLAADLGRPFVELDERVEEAAGLRLAEIFALHGEAYYRKLEREVLQAVLTGADRRPPPPVLATGGGLVTEPATYAFLRRHAVTVWLKATPADHWERVVQQGDSRPMAGDSAHARGQLMELHKARAPLYAEATLTVDTSTLGIDGAVLALRRFLS